MIKQFASIPLVLVFSLIFGQNKSFVYELKWKSNPEKDSIATEKFALDISDGKSMFRTLKEKEADSTFHTTKRFSFTTTSFKDFKTVSKDLNLKETKKFITHFQKLFTIKINDELVWNIEKDTKETLGMKTQKATTIYGGRDWTAWFTNDIPLQEADKAWVMMAL